MAEPPNHPTEPPGTSLPPGDTPGDTPGGAPGGAPAETVPIGADLIKAELRNLPTAAGVYRMLNDAGDVLYVGKAKSLRKRVQAYANPERQSIRMRRMIAETRALEVVTTHTEAEALLLEADLIKRYAPRYNILLRDDKSFPLILLTGDHAYPRIVKHRGAKKRAGDYFGPFASVGAVNHTLNILQRAFLLRNCADTVFKARTRPCLLYQIKRCAAPCVGRVSEAEYGELVDQARAFLTGGSQRIQQDFARRMQGASDALEFEEAAQYRDRIQALTRVQTQAEFAVKGLENADVIGIHQAGGVSCVQVFFFRGGHSHGNRAYYPSHAKDDAAPVVLEAFLGQFYAKTPPPKTVLVSEALPHAALVAEALGVRAGRKVTVLHPKRGPKRKPVAHVVANAREALARRMAESASQRRLLDGLTEALRLDAPPDRIEVYDNSHVSGSKAVGGMIVAGPEGFEKAAYRKFNIKATTADGFTPGDDYAMMREVLTRRFSRALKEDPDRQQGQWPDLVIVDGGAGQLGVAAEVFADLGIDDVGLCAIAKGPDRNAGRERVFMTGRNPFSLNERDPVLYFLQRLRDEAHRFAIGAHRGRRTKQLTHSLLDDVPGIGAKRKRALLHHFGAANAVSQAAADDLAAVDGISHAMARKIYDWFHPDD